MVGQKQPQGHVKRKDQGSPQARSKQRSCQDSPKPVVLPTPGGVEREGAWVSGSSASDCSSLPTPPSPCFPKQ